MLKQLPGRLKRLTKSTAFRVASSFTLVTIFMSALLAPTEAKASTPSIFWYSLLTKGLPFGLFVVLIVVLQVRSSRLVFGVKKEQVPLLQEAVKTGVLPKDKKLRDALPGYMHNTYTWTKPQNKAFFFFLIIVFGFNILMDIGSHDILKIIAHGIGAIGFIVFYMSTQDKAPTVLGLYEQLGVDPETAKPKRPKLQFGLSKLSPLELPLLLAKILLIFSGAVIATCLIFTGVFIGVAAPWMIAPLTLPMVALGLLYLVPYLILQGRWLGGYCLALVVATAAVVRQLNAPLGHTGAVAATVPNPTEVHNVLTYAGWAVFHSTKVLIITGALILLLIAATKKWGHQQKDAKTLWMIFAIIGVALTLFSFGITWR